MRSITDIIAAIDAGHDIDMPAEDLRAIAFAYCDCPFDSFWGYANAYRNRHLLSERLATGYSTDCPVYAVGSGPSLTRHIPWLRANQHRIVIVAGASTTDILLEHGIIATFTTPTERVVQGDLKAHPATVFAGYPWVPGRPNKQDQRCLFTPNSSLGRWIAGSDVSPVRQTLLSGCAAASFAQLIARGPVVLLGHDLCHADDGADHCGAYRHTNYSRGDMTVECYDGVVRRSTSVWMHGVRHMSESKLVATTPDAAVAKIDGVTVSEDMPVGLKVVDHDGSTGSGAGRVEALWDKLPSDIAVFRDEGKLPCDENDTPILAVMQPLWAAFSIERRLGRHPDVDSWFDEAKRSVLNTLIVAFSEACRAA